MDKWSNNRLTVLGPKAQLQRFLRSKWHQRLGARHGEWLEIWPVRHVSICEADEPPLESLMNLSRRWVGLIFLLEYEIQAERIKGLAKVEHGQRQHFELNY